MTIQHNKQEQIERQVIRIEEGITKLWDGYNWRQAELIICKTCGLSWYTREGRMNGSLCVKCRSKGELNGMYGKPGQNKGKGAYNRKSYQREQKKKLVALFGNKCHICGLSNLPLCNYDFHHLFPQEKEYQIKDLLSWKWEKLEKEIKKCVMVCSNCHRTTHHGNERLINE